MHVALGHPDPDFHTACHMLQQTMRSVCSILSKEGGAQHIRLPITPELLLKLRKVWQKDAGHFDICSIHCALGSM